MRGLLDTLDRTAPHLAGDVRRWLDARRPGEDAIGFFRHPDRFPVLALPDLVAESVGRSLEEPPFRRALVSATIAGYWQIRLLDDAQDGHGRDLLPLVGVTGVLMVWFLQAYRDWFPPASGFWRVLEASWIRQVETVRRESRETPASEHAFRRHAAGKMAAARIPVAAVLYRYRCEELLPVWTEALDLLACAEQLQDDLYDALDDAEAGRSTWWLSEGARRGAHPATWLIRGGAEWALARVDRWLDQLGALGMRLGAPGLIALAAARRDRAAHTVEELRPVFHQLERLHHMFTPTTESR